MEDYIKFVLISGGFLGHLNIFLNLFIVAVLDTQSTHTMHPSIVGMITLHR